MSYIGAQPTSAAFITDQYSGTGAQTAFTMSVAPATTASILVSVSGVLQDPTTYSITGTTLNFSSAPPSGTGNISVRYLGIPAAGVTTTAYRTVTEFTATAGQTTYTPPSYTVGYINVFRNGVRLGSADFTATNGTSVVLATGATVGDLITTESFYVSSVVNAIPAVAGAVNSTYLAANLSLTTPSVPTTLGVGGVTPASSGAGISFPATQSLSSDANTLDDYEEGTWTPNVYNSGSSSTFTGKVGYYRKVGSLVTCWFTCDYGNTGTSGTALVLSGLPFTIGSFSMNPTWGTWGGNGAGVYSSVIRSGGGTTMALCSGGSDVTGQYTFITGMVSYFTS